MRLKRTAFKLLLKQNLMRLPGVKVVCPSIHESIEAIMSYERPKQAKKMLTILAFCK